MILASASAFMPAKAQTNRYEGIWQLTVPSRNNEKSKVNFIPIWKVYYPNGKFAVMMWKHNENSSFLTFEGTYKIINDSILQENVPSKEKEGQTDENKIKVHFVNNNLINTFHHFDKSEGNWQELWKRITSKDDDSDMPYIKSLDENKPKVAQDLNGVYLATEKMPEYPNGGQEGIIKHIEKTISYPAEAQKQGLEGVSIIRFIVNEKGKPESLQIIRSSAPILDKEAARVIKTLQFKPGMHNGKKVKVYMTVPVKFRLK